MTDTLVHESQRDEEKTLPQGWSEVRIGEIANEINPGFPSGKHNQDGTGIPHLRPMNINAKGEIDLSVLKYVQSDTYKSLQAGDVLFNNTNSPALLGKTAVITKDTNWAYSNHMTRIRLNPALASPQWVAHGLHKLFYEGFYKLNCRNHVNQASIGKAFLSNEVVIPLPPLSEQHRIAEKIEELFTKLDAGVASLHKARGLLKRYRQSVLKAAVEGELSREWREAHPDVEPASALLDRLAEERRQRFLGRKYKEPSAPSSTDELPELPTKWAWASLGQLAWNSGYGTSTKCSYDFNGQPVLRIPNIQAGELRLDDIKFAQASAKLKATDALQPGDLLVIRTNGSKDLIGRAAVVKKGLKRNFYFASYLIRYRLLGNETLASWLGTLWNSYRIRRWIEQMAATSAGQYNISMTSLDKLAIEVPPLGEQGVIVQEVEKHFSVIDELEQSLASEISRANHLRQSILNQAFTGKLVPQDPADEPASVLLERIKAQHDQSKNKQGRLL